MPDPLLSYFVAEGRNQLAFLEACGYRLTERASEFYAELFYERTPSDRVEVFFGDEDLYMTVMILHGDMAHPLSDWIRVLKLEDCETLKREFNHMLLTSDIAISDALACYAQDLKRVLDHIAKSQEDELSKIWKGIAEEKEQRIQQEVATWISTRTSVPASGGGGSSSPKKKGSSASDTE